MADSVREAIMKVMATKLATITTGNGYNNTIVSVQRFNQIGQVTAAIPAIILHEGEDTGGDAPDPLTSRELEVSVQVFTRHDVTADARSSEEVANTFRADLATLVGNNRSWSGLAVDTKPPDFSPIFVEDGEPDLTFFADFTVKYRHRYTDPTAAT